MIDSNHRPPAAPVIGFLGFGEAASTIAAGLHEAGAGEIRAFDVLAGGAKGATIASRAKAAGVRLAETPAGLAETCDVLFSLVVAGAAVDAARSVAPFLRDAQIFVEMNSVSPERKQEIAEIIRPAGARFVEAAIMANVAGKRHRVPILACGDAVADLVAMLAPFGMEIEDFGPEIGRAAATKMFRSIMVKGLEALFLECTLAASRYGVAERVLASVGEGYPGLDWNRLADVLIARTARHGARRADELDEVASTLRSMGLEPLMASAAAARIRTASVALGAAFAEEPPARYRDVVSVINDRL